MKKKAALSTSLLFLVFLSETYAIAAPYWLKPGSHIEYYANGTNPDMPNTWGGGAYYRWDGCTAHLGFQAIRVIFSVTKVSDGWAFINVTVTLYGDKSLKWPYSDVYAYYPSACNPPFPNPVNTTPYTRNNVSLKWSDYGTHLSIHGAYRIDLSTGTVYSTSGRAFGHTLLFDLYPHHQR